MRSSRGDTKGDRPSVRAYGASTSTSSTTKPVGTRRAVDHRTRPPAQVRQRRVAAGVDRALVRYVGCAALRTIGLADPSFGRYSGKGGGMTKSSSSRTCGCAEGRVLLVAPTESAWTRSLSPKIEASPEARRERVPPPIRAEPAWVQRTGQVAATWPVRLQWPPVQVPKRRRRLRCAPGRHGFVEVLLDKVRLLATFTALPKESVQHRFPVMYREFFVLMTDLSCVERQSRLLRKSRPRHTVQGVPRRLAGSRSRCRPGRCRALSSSAVSEFR